MYLRLFACLATFAYVALLPFPPALAQVPSAVPGSDCQDKPPLAQHWSQDRLAKFDAAMASFEQDVAKHQALSRQAMQWSQDRLSDFDAVIASLQQDLSAPHANARAEAENVLVEVRDRRDAYRAKVKDIATNVTAGAQAAAAGKSLDEAANAFWAAVDAYLDMMHADIDTRQAAMQTRFLGD